VLGVILSREETTESGSTSEVPAPDVDLPSQQKSASHHQKTFSHCAIVEK
jgi:hypothetical protein